MAKLIGTAPNQVPTNGDLGSMAFEDRNNYITKGASVHQPYRNLIINGDMSIAQRGTSATSVSSSGYHSLDRFLFGFNETDELVATISQDTDVPSGQGFANSMKFEVTTPETTLATDEILQIIHRMEGQNTQNLKYGTSSAESLTLSFWVKSSITGTYVITFKNNDPSAGTRLNVNTYTINSANTWEKKTITITGDTTANTNFVNTNAKGLELNWSLAAGGSYQGTSSSGWTSYGAEKLFNGQSANVITTSGATWYITGVQLEVGTSSSDFEFLPYDVNLTRCMRYFERVSRDGNRAYGPIANGMQRTTTQAYGHVMCRVLKRASATSVSQSNIIVTDRLTTDADVTAIGNISTDYQGVHMDFTHASFGAVYRPVLITGDNSTGGYVDIDSEL